MSISSATKSPLSEHVHSVAVHRTIAINEEKARKHTFKIAHISDPHISRIFHRNHILSFRRILQEIAGAGFDHLVITGDLVSTADPDDYYLVRKILEGFDLLHPQKLTVVPGNHDVFGGPHRAADILNFPQHIRSIDYVKGLELFEEAFSETFEGVHRLREGVLFPFVKHVEAVDILGLNSVPPWSLRRNILGTNGALDEEQWDALARFKELRRDTSRPLIAALHHHFNDLHDASHSNTWWRRIETSTMRMRKRRKLIRYLSEAHASLVLHGHVHRNEIYPRGEISVANGAGAICDDPFPFLKYNAITWDGDSLKVAIKNLSIPYIPAGIAKSHHNFKSVRRMPSLIKA